MKPARTLEVIGITGPITGKPSGKFTADGLAVTKPCVSYWTVRVQHGTVLQDHKFCSSDLAEQFAEGIRTGRIVEMWSSGTGFILRGHGQ